MGLTVIIGQLSLQLALDMPTGDELDNIWKLCLAPCYVKCGLLGIFYGGVLEQQHNCQWKLLPGDGDESVAIINLSNTLAHSEPCPSNENKVSNIFV